MSVTFKPGLGSAASGLWGHGTDHRSTAATILLKHLLIFHRYSLDSSKLPDCRVKCSNRIDTKCFLTSYVWFGSLLTRWCLWEQEQRCLSGGCVWKMKTAVVFVSVPWFRARGLRGVGSASCLSSGSGCSVRTSTEQTPSSRSAGPSSSSYSRPLYNLPSQVGLRTSVTETGLRGGHHGGTL